MVKQKAHTPGPWKSEIIDGRVDGVNYQYSPTAKIQSRDRYIGSVKLVSIDYSGTAEEREETEANARLIAAAPELLEALRGIIEIGKRDCLSNPKYDGYFDAAKEAIAKAEGR